MQSLFAFHQARVANHLLALDSISEKFSPDLNAMVQPDRSELEAKKKQAFECFELIFNGKELPANYLPEITEAAQAALTAYQQAVKKDFAWFKNNLVSEVQRLDDLYLTVLALAVALADAARLDKKINHRNFTDNPWIEALRQVPAIKQKEHTVWAAKQADVRRWVRDVLKADQEYMNYLDRQQLQEDDQKKCMLHLFRRLILGKTLISEYFESEILRWAEDREIIKGMVEKTIKTWHPAHPEPLKLHALSLNWDEDREFIEKLFEGAAFLPQEYRQHIAANTRNWEVERLPLTDQVILEMAVTEMTTFPSIPVKVTINEYIELAKGYSTPKSRQFINGILDALAKELAEAGYIKKSGRGLIDNK
jgi:N utilization substance protein B